MIEILDPQKLINLYTKGFFPMAESVTSNEIKFYKPIKRLVIPIYDFHLPKKLFRKFKKNIYTFTLNKNFNEVIYHCASPRKKNKDTWINEVIKNSYMKLNKLNIAHSIECWRGKELVGGLYGVHIGSCFFGESMFSKISNASKLCLMYLVLILIKNKFLLLDSQFYNSHLLQFGAYEISDYEYQKKLKKGLAKKNKFADDFNFQESLLILHSLTQTS